MQFRLRVKSYDLLDWLEGKCQCRPLTSKTRHMIKTRYYHVHKLKFSPHFHMVNPVHSIYQVCTQIISHCISICYMLKYKRAKTYYIRQNRDPIDPLNMFSKFMIPMYYFTKKRVYYCIGQANTF